MKDILTILEKDALTPHHQIGEMLGKSEAEVKAAIQELENEKIIIGYTTIIDQDRANRNLVRALIEVKVTPERDGGFDHIASRIAKYPEVQSCHLMSGAFDLLVVVQGEDLKQVARFVSGKLATIAGVVSTATHFILKPYKEYGHLFEADGQSERLMVSP